MIISVIQASLKIPMMMIMMINSINDISAVGLRAGTVYQTMPTAAVNESKAED